MTRPQTPGTDPARAPGRGGDSASLPGARTMTPAAAAWVREHVWTQPMRKTHREVSKFYLTCACQFGATHWCRQDQHELCHRATPLRSTEAAICRRGGVQPAEFTEPYGHETDTSATGPAHEYVAQVWLADRVCRWVCPCPCGHQPAAVPVQGELFAAVA